MQIIPALDISFRQTVGSAQQFSSHVLMLLDVLKNLIPDPDDTGMEAYEFLQHILIHTEYHQDHLIKQMQAIDRLTQK